MVVWWIAWHIYQITGYCKCLPVIVSVRRTGTASGMCDNKYGRAEIILKANHNCDDHWEYMMSIEVQLTEGK